MEPWSIVGASLSGVLLVIVVILLVLGRFEDSSDFKTAYNVMAMSVFVVGALVGIVVCCRMHSENQAAIKLANPPPTPLNYSITIDGKKLVVNQP